MIQSPQKENMMRMSNGSRNNINGNRDQDLVALIREAGGDSSTKTLFVRDNSDFLDYERQISRGSERMMPYQYDQAWFLNLKDVDWHLFVTLQFARRGYRFNTDRGRSLRKDYVRNLFHELKDQLHLPANAIQYFCTEELNAEGHAHCHLLVCCPDDERASVDDVRAKLLELITHKDIILPPGSSPEEMERHVVKIRSKENAVRYVLKMPAKQKGRNATEPKPYLHSVKLVRFIIRHRNRTNQVNGNLAF